MENHYLQHISVKTGFSFSQIKNVFALHTEGATIPFMARYRKEATSNLDEVAIDTIVEEIGYFSELSKRKETILKTIESLGQLSPELQQRISDSYDATELEDLYIPYKPKRKTKAVVAVEKGLEPLAMILFKQTMEDPASLATGYLNQQVTEISDALRGARDIIAEWVAENEQARNRIRKLFAIEAWLVARVIKSKKEENGALKYRDYFEFSEALLNCPSHRILAIRRGEKEGFLTMDISVDEVKAIDALKIIFVKNRHGASEQVEQAVKDSYQRLLKPSIENEFRLLSKNKADEEAITVFSGNLRQLLLASPLGAKRILALDPGFRTGCKVVCLNEQGNFLHNSTIYPHPPQMETAKATAALQSLVQQFNIEAIGVGNGTAGRETEQLIRQIDFGKKIQVFMVNENGASIYSASEVAREEFPEEDITVRGAISIGRRLLDPLSELVKIDAKSIGVGQYQHDVNQSKLKEALDKVVVSCVNTVGVDVNTASKHLLSYVSGLSNTLAKNLVEFRTKYGSFSSRDQLKKVSLMGPKSFEQCAGFLRIGTSSNPLDNSAVHPESYPVVEKIAKDLLCTVPELIKDSNLKSKVNIRQYISEATGAFTLTDILNELEQPGRDPRAQLEEFRFDENIHTIEDLKPGMVLPGVVTNITNFGVFIDIGVKQDGLVHISQLSNHFISDPNTVVKLQQQVKVTVTEVDVARKRIALSMKEQLVKSSGPQKPSIKLQEKQEPPSGNRSVDPFHQKLAELKKKFK